MQGITGHSSIYHAPKKQAVAVEAARGPRRRGVINPPRCGCAYGGAAIPTRDAADHWKRVALISALTLFLLNMHRSVFTMLLPVLSEPGTLSVQGLHPGGVAQLQSAMLLGYLAGQLPAGWLSDAAGGERVLLGGLLLASLATAATALAPLASLPLAALLVARAAMGLFSAVRLKCFINI